MEFINQHIIYVYYLVFIIIAVVLFCLLKQLLALFKTLKPINEHLNNIKEESLQLKEKMEAINHTSTVSIPYFKKSILTAVLFKEVFNDFKDTSKEKRNLLKSYKKITKLKNSLK